MQIMDKINKPTHSTKQNTDPTNSANEISPLKIAEGFNRHLVDMCGDHNTCGWTSILYQTHPEFQKTLEYSRKCLKLLPVFETRKELFDQIDTESAKFVPDTEQPLQKQSAQTFSNPPSQKIAKIHHPGTALKAREPQKKTTPQQELQSRIKDVCSKLYTIPGGSQAFSELIDHIYGLLERNSLPFELTAKIVEILTSFKPSEDLTKILKEASTHNVIDASLLNDLQSPATDPAGVSQIILEKCEQIRAFAYPYLARILDSFEDRGEKSKYTKEDLEKQQEALTKFHKVFYAPKVKSFAEMRSFLKKHLKPLFQLIEPIRRFLTEIETEKANFRCLLNEIENLKTEVISAELQRESSSIEMALIEQEIDSLSMENGFLPAISQHLDKPIVLVEYYGATRGFEIFFSNNRQLSIDVGDLDLSLEDSYKKYRWNDDGLLKMIGPEKKNAEILGELLNDRNTIGLYHEGQDHYQALASVH